MKTSSFLGNGGPAALAAVCFGLLSSGVRSETAERDFHIASVGDRLVLNVYNELGNASTSIHFHGFFQNGTNHMDGAVGVTQCGIPPDESFTYDIEPGTYWYHAHNNGQYLDGLRGTIVVHDPVGPHEDQYDAEIVLSLSDWYHRLSSELLGDLISPGNPTGAEPVPQAALLNDTQNLQVPVEPGKTYLVHIANVAGFAAFRLWFEGHSMRVVEVDGVWTEPADASVLYIAAAQRYSVLLTMRSDAAANFAMVAAMDCDLFDDIPDGLAANVSGWLVYDRAKPLPEPTPLASFDDLDDFGLVPYDRQALLDHVDLTITLAVKMDNLRDGANYAFFNDLTYVAPKVPSLYSALTVGAANATNSRVYGTYAIPQVLPHLAVVEVVVNNGDDGMHPFHLHGHNFQVVSRSADDAGDYNSNSPALPAIPMRRDTVSVCPNGNVVVRFRADNPGVWLFHCHIEWHMEQGLIATFVEAPEALQGLSIPPDHLAACAAAGTPTAGNAAGNTHDVLNPHGQNKPPPPPLYRRFTSKGYIALFFITAVAMLGMAYIAKHSLIKAAIEETSIESQPLIPEEGGAAAVTALAAEEHFDVIKVFERREDPGGTWIYDAVPPSFGLTPGALPPVIDKPLAIPSALPRTTTHSMQERYAITPIYDDLTTNVPEIAMSLSDQRFPYGPFVPHWIPKNYIRQYISTHGQDGRLVLNTTVEDITRLPNASSEKHDRWRLTLRRHDLTRNVDEWWEEEFDAVILANGHYSVPYVPFVPGLADYLERFPGRVVHSKTYRSPKPFAGKRVLVIGNSASGHDVTDQLLRSGLVRSPLYQSRRSTSRWDGDEPPAGLVWKPIITEYTSDGTIIFADGSTLGPKDIDVIVYATGYKASYPFWNVEANGRPLYDYDANRFVGTFQHTFVHDLATLAVIGLPRTLTFRSFEYQAIAIARVWAGRARLPPEDEQRRWESERVALRKKEDKNFHDVEWDSGETAAYLDFLFRLAGLPQLDGKGRIPPILDAKTRWAIENIRKYPLGDRKGSQDGSKDDGRPSTDERGWVVVEQKKDSLTFL
ncbi:iron transport multicopper oxidase fet3 precursor [Grosmannia clavigera kw1407]|uniref:Iron transport multicopper oxidase fet3 n=1 Tax=Grosmannia clavigera (strain kw1407 / UAMH 11150) TaxID=655863 RepID=F0XKB3_GROCL|nr:iron transport multicopper oxidase fet3 precursor [Grosmannia clavigera kw1407]EFX01899.1 iron transport multicopper oxidase fet3 precursor [Grosmannia clavigera kw1407]